MTRDEVIAELERRAAELARCSREEFENSHVGMGNTWAMASNTCREAAALVRSMVPDSSNADTSSLIARAEAAEARTLAAERERDREKERGDERLRAAVRLWERQAANERLRALVGEPEPAPAEPVVGAEGNRAIENAYREARERTERAREAERPVRGGEDIVLGAAPAAPQGVRAEDEAMAICGCRGACSPPMVQPCDRRARIARALAAAEERGLRKAAEACEAFVRERRATMERVAADGRAVAPPEEPAR